MLAIRRKTMLPGLLSALLAVSSPSWATVYFGEDLGIGEGPSRITTFPNASAAQANFLSQLVGVGIETFEAPDQTEGQLAPLVLTFPGAGTATLTGDGSITAVAPGSTNGFGRFGTSGVQYWEATATFGINFSNPVAAFGFYGIDIGDFDGQVTITALNGGTNVYNVGNTLSGPGGSVLFWGLIDTVNPITNVTFGNTNAGTDFFAFDDMIIGSAEQVIPEPGSMALLGLGLTGLAMVRRRKSC